MSELWRRVGALLRGERLDRELEEELRFHLEMKARETGDEAEARRALGNDLAWRERARDAWGWAWAENLLTDVRFVLRMFWRSPGFTAVAVAMLALGVGLNALVFTITNAVLFIGYPMVRDNDSLLYLTTGSDCCVSYPDYLDWRAQATSFDDMGMLRDVHWSFRDDRGTAATLYMTQMTANMFRITGQQPVIGRDFAAADEAPGAEPVAIIRYSFWESHYAKDPGVVGRKIWITGVPTTIVGVMPKGFSFPQNQDIWLPMVPTPELLKRDYRSSWFAIGRLKPGVSGVVARAEMATVFEQVKQAHPEAYKEWPEKPRVQTFQQLLIGPNATAIYRAMLAAVGLVLLIACGNLANLLLARAIGRSREMAVRMALGAGRWRITRQLAIESLLLSAAGGGFGYVLARGAVAAYAATANGPRTSDFVRGIWFDGVIDYSMDGRVLAYLIAVSVATGLLFGIFPMLRLGQLDVCGTLKDGGRGAVGGRRSRRLSRWLVAAEMALAVVLLAGAGVMVRSFWKLYTADYGFDPKNVAVAMFGLPVERYPDGEARVRLFEELRRRVAAMPGVERAAVSGGIPSRVSFRAPYELADAKQAAVPGMARSLPRLQEVGSGPGYFDTLGTGIVAGRDFRELDRTTRQAVAIVSRRFARANWPGADPLGRRLRIYRGDEPGPWMTVVGVAPDIAQVDAVRPEMNSVVYVPYWQPADVFTGILVKTREPLGRFSAALTAEVQKVDPLLPVLYGPVSLEQEIGQAYQYRGVTGAMFLLCAVIALALASVGLYAVIAHSVGQRTQEIGVRMALGATAGNALELVFRQGMVPLAAGLAAGLAGSVMVNRMLAAQLVQVSPMDPLTLGVASAALVTAGMLGCWIPARRAMRVDPAVALRHE